MQYPKIMSAVLALALCTSSALAQDTDNADAAAPSLPDTSTAQSPEAYVAETHGDWSVRCIKVNEGPEPCQMYQLLTDNSGGSVAEMVLFPLPGDDEAVAAAVVTTPLETLLTQDVTIVVDQAEGRRYPFSFCSTAGCISRIGLRSEDVDSFRRGNSAVVRIVPARAPEQEVLLKLSLAGFTASYKALEDRLAEN